jgi:aryl-alcohol dehydrogenase-like predicted oxidoreductase
MHYRPFARTGLYVSELCLGSMTFGGKGYWESIGKLTAPEVERFVGTSLDAGVNFIDTADVYSEGESERLVGAALSALHRPRDQFLVATKVRGRTGPGVNQIGLSSGHILSSIDASLSRLKLDFVDLYQIHGTDRETPIEETVRALDDVVRSGKARYAGFCNLSAWYAMKALAFSNALGFTRFVSAQMYYSIAGRDIERDIVPFVKEEGLALLPWSPLAGGLLSGKFDFEHPGPAGSRRTSFDFPPVDKARAASVVKAMRIVAVRMGISVARVALSWLLSRPFVTSVIIGAKTPEQLADNLAATDTKLSPDDVAMLDTTSALPPEYPGWMIDWQDRDRRPS